MILGLDISTSVIGISLLDEQGNVVFIDHVNLKKTKGLYEKLQVFKDFLIQNLKIHTLKLTNVYVEEALQMFRTRSSMAQVIALLQRFNGMCCSLLYQLTGIGPETLNVLSARKLVGIKTQKYSAKTRKKHGLKPEKVDVKMIVFDHIRSRNIVNESTWKYKKTGKPVETNFDMCDSLVIALAGVELERQKNGTISQAIIS